jgi:hypothetical protein
VRTLVILAMLASLLGCTSEPRSKKDPCGATVSVAPQTVVVGMCRE